MGCASINTLGAFANFERECNYKFYGFLNHPLSETELTETGTEKEIKVS